MNHFANISLLAAALIGSQSYFLNDAIANPVIGQQSTVVAQKSAAKSTPCQLSAFIADNTPVNVHSGPSSNFKVIAKLPIKQEVVVTITACQGSWLKIGQAKIVPDNKVLFEGKTGWVSASTLGIGISLGATGKAPIYANPDVKSKVVTNVTKAASGAKLLGGQGQWIHIKYKNFTGWIIPENQCANPLTTCS
jgi:SH3-like domain-containing protein